MVTKTRKSSPRLSALPPGVMAFADGGKPETADELMARMSAKYGVPAAGPAQAAPVQQPAPQQQQKTPARPEQQGITTGIVGILKGRAAQIDKAVDGYAEGGKISGPGTPKSDSIPATVRETGEGIRVSTDGRCLRDVDAPVVCQGDEFDQGGVERIGRRAGLVGGEDFGEQLLRIGLAGGIGFCSGDQANALGVGAAGDVGGHADFSED